MKQTSSAARRVAIVGALTCGLLLSVTSARADDQAAQCKIYEIEATNGEPNIDPKLEALARKLKRPPFSSWKRFRLVKQWNKRVVDKASLELDLEKGGTFEARYRGHVVPKQGKAKWRMDVSMRTKDKKSVAKTDYSGPAGDYLVVGYANKKGDGHLVAVQCKPKE